MTVFPSLPGEYAIATRGANAADQPEVSLDKRAPASTVQCEFKYPMILNELGNGRIGRALSRRWQKVDLLVQRAISARAVELD